MERYILDTNLFFNMAAGLDLGGKTEDVVKKMTEAIQKAKIERSAEFYMPPAIVDEFLSFFDDKEQLFIQALLGAVTIKAPDYRSINLSATVFYELIQESRQRAYRGLTIGEEEITHAAKDFMGKQETNTKDFQIGVGSIIKGFRDRYRNATRTGFIDSVGDLDLIMLAKEVDGVVVSTDEGVIRWSRILGVKEIPVSVFGQKVKLLAPAA